ncbi:MAG: ABC transporter permease [Lachnospiraceae bacterium]|nr:ABC transporter permease [Lachnospiraceae bacterium]MDD7076802.1 ABC transporter permease subunit [Lachnospiraceae bacterium]MDY3729817.1 ABC transporter permease subunit [Candidatus Choladocola sp.]
MNGISLTKRKNISGSTEKKLPINGGTGRHALYRKELADHLKSRRFLILLLLIGTTSFASLYGAVSGLADVLESDGNFAFLKLYTTSGSSIPSFMSFIALLGPIIGLALGFDAINSERTGGTLNRLASQPIYRDSIIIGKFMAGLAVISTIIYTMGIALGAVGILVTGLKPSGEEVVRILIFLTFTVIYVAFWLALSIFFSVICRHAATSALASIAVWMFFAVFMSLVASIIANAMYPVNTDYNAAVNALNNYTLNLNLNRISPSYLYSEAVSTIMNPSVRTVNIVTMDQLVGAISGYLSLGQSLLLVWPHLTGLAALMLVAFGGSYIGFMRQEVRTN